MPSPCLTSKGDAITGQEGINYAPGATPPWTVAVGAEYAFHLGERDAFVRADWEYQSRNPWLANMQDPNNNATYNYGYSYTLPSTNFVSMRAGVSLAQRLAARAVLRQPVRFAHGDQLLARPDRWHLHAAAERLHVPAADHRPERHLAPSLRLTRASCRRMVA